MHFPSSDYSMHRYRDALQRTEGRDPKVRELANYFQIIAGVSNPIVLIEHNKGNSQLSSAEVRCILCELIESEVFPYLK